MKLHVGKITYDIIVADKLGTKLRGFMFIKDINYGLLYPKHNLVHTFFFKSRIDIVGLDQDNKVIYKYDNINKFKFIKIKNKRKNTSILELPKNASKKIKIGQTLVFESKDII